MERQKVEWKFSVPDGRALLRLLRRDVKELEKASLRHSPESHSSRALVDRRRQLAELSKLVQAATIANMEADGVVALYILRDGGCYPVDALYLAQVPEIVEVVRLGGQRMTITEDGRRDVAERVTAIAVEAAAGRG